MYRGTIITTLLLTGWLLASPLTAAEHFSLEFHEAGLTMEARDVPLRTVLAGLASQAHMAIYLSEKIQDTPVNIALQKVSVEKALATLLRNYNYVVSLKDENGRSRVTLLKIYPKGTYSGALRPLTAESPAEADGPPASPADVFLPGGSRGTVAPVTSVDVTGESDNGGQPLPAQTALELAFRQEQQQLFAEQLRIQRQLAATTDPERRRSLTMAYAAQAEKIKQSQKAQINRIESLKRLQALTGDGQPDQP